MRRSRVRLLSPAPNPRCKSTICSDRKPTPGSAFSLLVRVDILPEGKSGRRRRPAREMCRNLDLRAGPRSTRPGRTFRPGVSGARIPALFSGPRGIHDVRWRCRPRLRLACGASRAAVESHRALAGAACHDWSPQAGWHDTGSLRQGCPGAAGGRRPPRGRTKAIAARTQTAPNSCPAPMGSCSTIAASTSADTGSTAV